LHHTNHNIPYLMNTAATNVPAVSDDSEGEDECMMVQPQQIRRRRVRFSDCNQEHEVPSRGSFTTEEMRAKWYRKREYQEIRQEAFATVDLYRSGRLLAGDTDRCIRGLEGKTEGTTKQGFRATRNDRREASFKVVDEQDRQDEMGICNPDLIADVYQAASLYSRCAAHARGLLDAHEVVLELLSQLAGTDLGMISQVAPSFDEALAHSVQLHFLNSSIPYYTTAGPQDSEAYQEYDNASSIAMDMDWTSAVDICEIDSRELQCSDSYC
jgi:hypothetical protein